MRTLAIGSLIGLAAASIMVAGPADAAASKPRLDKLVTLKDIRRHQKDLQTIADYNGGTRAAGEPGFEVSVKYIVKRLQRAGYAPSVQDFPFAYFKEKTPSVLEQTAPNAAKYTHGTDYATLDYSGSGDVTATATAVDPDAAGTGSGCEAGDFSGFPQGNIALIRRGGCTFELKADNAQKAGAAAVLIYQRPDVQDSPVAGTLGRPFTLPVIGPTNKLGTELVKAALGGGLKLHVKTNTISEQRTAHNVIADTARGRADNVVVVGAHLDSVTRGPGINDNGSGTAAVLTTAEQIGKLGAGIKNRVRFAFWGAEEEGLLGSEYYVAHLSPAEKSAIALNINFDMLGSPNGIRGVQDGDGSAGTNQGNVPAGSGAIEKTFADYYTGRSLRVEQLPFNGRSDYGPFAEAGIPAGGLESGAEVLKTAEQAAIYGGTAGKPYDACYHQACDTYDNVNLTLLDQLADGVAYATQAFANSTLPVNGGRQTARTPAKPGTAPRAGRDTR